MNIEELASWYLIALSLYHFWTGSISYLAPNAAMRFYANVYGCDPVERRHLLLILRPWGALAVFAGIVGLNGVWQPVTRPLIELGLVVLLLMRVGYRVGLRRELRDISRIAPHRNAISIGILLLGAALLSSDLWLQHRAGAWFFDLPIASRL